MYKVMFRTVSGYGGTRNVSVVIESFDTPVAAEFAVEQVEAFQTRLSYVETECIRLYKKA